MACIDTKIVKPEVEQIYVKKEFSLKEERERQISLNVKVENVTIKEEDMEKMSEGVFVKEEAVEVCITEATEETSMKEPPGVVTVLPAASSQMATEESQLNQLDPSHKLPSISANYICNQCGKSYRSKGALRKHIYTHLPKVTKRPTIQTNKKTYQCKQCDYKCSRKLDFRRHELTHTGEKPFKCDFCNFKCSRKSNLQIHLLTHSGDKPFECSQCDYRSTNKAHLRRHQIVHSDEKPFQCSYCDLKFSRKAHMRRHQKTHTGEKPFECSQCGFKCIQKDYLRIHQNVHTGEKPFNCNICEFKTGHKSAFLRHMRSKHPGEKLS